MACVDSRLRNFDEAPIEDLAVSRTPPSYVTVLGSLKPDIQRAVECIGLLLYVPDEYLSRTLRTQFLRRAITLDLLVFTADTAAESCNIMRAFCSRLLAFPGLAIFPVGESLNQFLPLLMFLQEIHSYMIFLIRSPASSSIKSVTLDLIQYYFKFVEQFRYLAVPLTRGQNNCQVRRVWDGRVFRAGRKAYSPSIRR